GDQRLVDVDPRVRQRRPPDLGAGHQQDGAEAGGPAYRHRRDRGRDVLHRVVDRKAGRDRPARRVDVYLDLLLRVVRGEEDQLGDDQVGQDVVDGPADDHDPVAQQAGVDVEGALAVAALVLDDGGDPGHGPQA